VVVSMILTLTTVEDDGIFRCGRPSAILVIFREEGNTLEPESWRGWEKRGELLTSSLIASAT
jgi:hypothetical protein